MEQYLDNYKGINTITQAKETEINNYIIKIENLN